MICPGCKTATQIEEVKTEYIYPNYILGLPAFWGFMSPALARLVLIVIAVLGIGVGLTGLLWVLKGLWIMSIFPLLIVAMIVYTLVGCVKALHEYRIKKHYRCLSCRLEWSGFSAEK